jgi:mono/diheme cytochrome c family protein
MLWRRYFVTLILLAAVGGCDSPSAKFELSLPYLRKQEKDASTEFTLDQRQGLADILAALFGTPDAPYIPAGGGTGIEEVLDASKLRMAAGAVSSDQEGAPHGLYRKHCAHCHGVTGDGMGPTAAFLNPYPRDYRMGVFKFKSTPKGGRPTDADLHKTLVKGIPGTAMPSFRLLADTEIDALIDYVKYLSIRGEVERQLADEMAFELDEGEQLEVSGEFLLEDVVTTVVDRWRMADSQTSQVVKRPEWDEEETLASIHRGRELFYGAVANCVKCHGNTQLGDGQRDDYDDWSKDYEDLTKVIKRDDQKKVLSELAALGALMPRNIHPRNLREGVYRGGRRPVDLYLRILNGIDGSPMPAAILKPADAGPEMKGLTSDDVWHLVDYVRSLPYESLGTQATHDRQYKRSRM